MKLKLNRAATASVLAGLALTLGGCQIVAPKYFERKQVLHSVRTSAYNTVSAVYGDPTVHGDSGICRTHTSQEVKELLEKAAEADSNFACLKDTKDLCFGPYGKMIIRQASYTYRRNTKLIGISQDIYYYGAKKLHASTDSLRALEAEMDSLALNVRKQAFMVESFAKLQNLRLDFLGEFYALQELQTEYDVDTSSTTRLENAISAFYYIMQKNKIFYKGGENFVAGLAENHMDCDISGYLFMQFGKELGLDLIGVTLMPSDPKGNGHFVVACRQDGKITHYIETTELMYGRKSLELLGPLPASERHEKIKSISKYHEKVRGMALYIATKMYGQDSAKKMFQENFLESLAIEKSESQEIVVEKLHVGIYTAAEWEAANRVKWESIKYEE